MTIPAGAGRFVTFEGGEGTGKSTQVALLARRLREAGQQVVTTREPGGAPEAEAIRELLVTGAADRWDAEAEALLHFAARRMHLVRTVWPALQAGQWVLCDRFVDSTMAYQGIAGRLGTDKVAALAAWTMGDFLPGLTLVLDLAPDLGLARAADRQAARGAASDRYERMGADYHERVAAAFRRIAAENPDRCRLVPAGGAPEAVADRIWDLVAARFPLPC
ncbi:dTMP kinase [Marinibaculum pumilum]|uniref:Thymidylate kinase n=1 Tax=Marinibaculum pumilum TaxID=1766165 RepID=A0ABV7KUB6_9PROT